MGHPYRDPVIPPRAPELVSTRTERAVVGLAVGSLVLGYALAIFACGTGLSEVAAEEAFRRERLRCVDDHALEADIRACDSEVKRKWGVAETVTVRRLDAGADR